MAAEYNESQMAAVTAGLDRSPVILIQVKTPLPLAAQVTAAPFSWHGVLLHTVQRRVSSECSSVGWHSYLCDPA